MRKNIKITIAGYGFVGKAHAEVMCNSHLVTISDPAFPEHNNGIPSDTSAIVKTAQRNNVELSLIQEAIEYNKRIRKE